MSTNTWDARALPILNAIAAAEQLDGGLNLPELCEQLGCSEEQLTVEIQRLQDGSYFTATTAAFGRGFPLMADVRLTERGARVVGVWPSDDPFESLLAILGQEIADPETDGETRTKLQSLRAVLTEVGKGTATGVLTALLRGHLGI